MTIHIFQIELEVVLSTHVAGWTVRDTERS